MEMLINEMLVRHKKEIKDLQKSCKHPLVDWDITKFEKYFYSECQVDVCRFCGKVIRCKLRDGD